MNRLDRISIINYVCAENDPGPKPLPLVAMIQSQFPNKTPQQIAIEIDCVEYFTKRFIKGDQFDCEVMWGAVEQNAKSVVKFLLSKFPHLILSTEEETRLIYSAKDAEMASILLEKKISECEKDALPFNGWDFALLALSQFQDSLNPNLIAACLTIAFHRNLLQRFGGPNAINEVCRRYQTNEGKSAFCELYEKMINYCLEHIDLKRPELFCDSGIFETIQRVISHSPISVQLTLPSQELYNKLVQEAANRKILAHANSIPSTEYCSYEGLSIEQELLSQRTVIFFLQKINAELNYSAMQIDFLIQTLERRIAFFEQPQNSESLLSIVHSGEVLALASGRLGHRFDIVFGRGLLTRVNKAAKYQFEFFSIDPSKVSQADLTEIDNWRSQKSEVVEKKFQDLAKRLESPLTSELRQYAARLQAIQPRRQTCGNCTWAAPKASLRLCLALHLANPNDLATWGQMIIAKSISKYLSTGIRVGLLERYKEKHPKESADSLFDDDLYQKAKKKTEHHVAKLLDEARGEFQRAFASKK